MLAFNRAAKIWSGTRSYYEVDKVDLAIVTHPDGDHIGGMGSSSKSFG